jgi:hypothetical protein
MNTPTTPTASTVVVEIVLNWRHLTIGPLRSRVLCGQPALMRNDNGDPCHKVCAEAIANKLRDTNTNTNTNRTEGQL